LLLRGNRSSRGKILKIVSAKTNKKPSRISLELNKHTQQSVVDLLNVSLGIIANKRWCNNWPAEFYGTREKMRGTRATLRPPL